MATKRKRGRAGRRGRYRWPRTEWLLVATFATALALSWLIARHATTPAVPAPALTMAQARAVNAAIPFVTDDPTPARPFRFHGTPAGREQAISCLATAALYEAGDDPRAQKAVIQVILNRVVLPHYPATVCGVVYQGAALPTGCQFSFACDGSQRRRPEHDGWEAARRTARRALDGAVYAPVGTATHYHTDWVVPYWAVTLDKIAQIRSHIFYRPHLRRRHATAPATP